MVFYDENDDNDSVDEMMIIMKKYEDHRFEPK